MQLVATMADENLKFNNVLFTSADELFTAVSKAKQVGKAKWWACFEIALRLEWGSCKGCGVLLWGVGQLPGVQGTAVRCGAAARGVRCCCGEWGSCQGCGVLL